MYYHIYIHIRYTYIYIYLVSRSNAHRVSQGFPHPGIRNKETLRTRSENIRGSA